MGSFLCGESGGQGPYKVPVDNEEALDKAVPGWRSLAPTICNYLARREQTKAIGDDAFGVVFAVTRFCNLKCRHCAVAAPHVARAPECHELELSTKEAVTVIEKTYRYRDKIRTPVFFMFGGGEPTLRRDFATLIGQAAELFGEHNTGFCTNGTFLPAAEVISIAEDVALLEVSLDGFEDYHNAWRAPRRSFDGKSAFQKTMELVRAALASVPEALEVTSVVTKENIEQLPDFARHLRDLGVLNYSVHRPIPVGRMGLQREMIPTALDYIRFFAKMAEVALESEQFRLHLHHSLETIYSVVFLGRDIHQSDFPMGSNRHSIGVSWDGTVHFDPWSLVPPFASLSPGSLLEDATELEALWDRPHSILNLVAEARKANVRCSGCTRPCTGGMRLVAMADTIPSHDKEDTLLPSQVMAAVSAVDPACPLQLN